VKAMTNELNKKLTRLQWLLRRYQLQNHAENGPLADSTSGQGRVLAVLRMQPEMTSKDLSFILGIRIQSLNELLIKLEKNGYINRVPSEIDKRVMVIFLTKKGEDEQPKDLDYSDMFDCLNTEEQIEFSGYLDRLIEAFEAQLIDEGDDDMFDWMNSARSRMGNERFERMMDMCNNMWGGGFFGGRTRSGGPSGSAQEDDTRSERFSQDYDGPMPKGFRGFPFGMMNGKM